MKKAKGFTGFNIKGKPIKIKTRSLLKRLSPFWLLTAFLIFFFLYIIFTKAETTTIKMIAVPFLAVNIIYADFALWNYLEGRKRGIIWTIESLISGIIIYWLL